MLSGMRSTLQKDAADPLGHLVDLGLRASATEAESDCAHGDLGGYPHGPQDRRELDPAAVAGRAGRSRQSFKL